MLWEHVIINDFITRKRIVHSKKLKVVLHKLRDIYSECVVIKSQIITCLKNKQAKKDHITSRNNACDVLLLLVLWFGFCFFFQVHFCLKTEYLGSSHCHYKVISIAINIRKKLLHSDYSCNSLFQAKLPPDRLQWKLCCLDFWLSSLCGGKLV